MSGRYQPGNERANPMAKALATVAMPAITSGATATAVSRPVRDVELLRAL